jgi:hypothetical protein
MATALLRSSIARLAASRFYWLSDAFFEISFWRKSTLLCRQLVLRTMLFSIVQPSTPGTSCAHAVLVASAMPTARTRGFSIMTRRNHATRRRHRKREDLGGSGSARSATVATSAQRSRSWRVASSWPRKSSPTWRRPAISASSAAVAW